MRDQPVSTFALDVSSGAPFGGLSHRRQRVEITTDMFMDVSIGRRVCVTDDEKWDEQPAAWYEEMLELETGIEGLDHRETNLVLEGGSQ